MPSKLKPSHSRGIQVVWTILFALKKHTLHTAVAILWPEVVSMTTFFQSQLVVQRPVVLAVQVP